MRSDTALLAKFSFDKSQQSDTIDGAYHLIVKKQKLYYLLEKGFFRIARKTNEYSVVEFFEPIGWKYVNERSEEHTSELQSRQYLVCRLLLEKKKKHK